MTLKGLTQTDIARAANVTPRSVGKWLKGGSIRPANLKALALEWTVGGSNPRHCD